MTDLVNPILQWLNNNPDLAGLVTFIIAAAESVAVIGTIVPGTVMMTAIGTLAGAGVIPLVPTLLWAAAGAVVGDGISYWLGHHYKERIRQVWPFRKHPEWLVRGEAFCHKYGGMSVFIGRFVGPVRALVPLVAGMLGMKPLRFYIANILSAIIWAPVYLFPGILLGAISLELPPDIAVHVILMLFFSLLFFILCSWLLLKFFFVINSRINQMLNGLWNHLQKSRAGHVVTYALKHHDAKKTHGQLVLAFYFILTSLLFLVLAKYIAINGSATLFLNQGFFYFFRSLHTPTLSTIMVGITLLGQKQIAVPLFILISVWLLISRRFYLAFHVIALLVFTIVFSEVAKVLVHSPRPTLLEKIPDGFSFPSGHTTFATTLYIGLALLLSLNARGVRKLFLFAAIIIAIVVGISRLYLEAHWFTDVVGSWLLGSALLILITISYNRRKVEPPRTSNLLLGFFFFFILIYGGYTYHAFQHQYENYKLINYQIYNSTNEVWWQQKDNELPRYRLNRFGIANQVLNIQWVGNLDEIKNILLTNNWKVPAERDWINVIMRLSDVQSMEYLPLLSPLYLDQKPTLVMVKRVDNSKNLIILRLWKSNVKLEDDKNDLWVGTVEPAPRTYHWILRKKYNFAISPEFIFGKVPHQYSTKLVVVHPHKKSKESQTILLIKPNR